MFSFYSLLHIKACDNSISYWFFIIDRELHYIVSCGFRNEIKDRIEFCSKSIRKEALKTILLMLAPLAPHISEELWQLLDSNAGSIHDQVWPKYDEELSSAELITLVVQINGKVRDRFQCPVGLEKKQTEEMVLASEKIQNLIEGKVVRKIIVVPDRLVNLVV